jgi:RNA polymerase sigma factor
MVFHIETLEDRVVKTKGDNEGKNKLISEFKPFIASVVQKKIGKFVEYGVDDELSIALMAFTEAIDSYDQKKGKFLGFARIVINLRLIDYYRTSNKDNKVSFEDDSDESIGRIIERKSVEQFRIYSEDEDTKLEVIEYVQLLREWGISLQTLVKVSPKKEILRDAYKKAARLIIDNNELLGEFLRTKRIPVKELKEFTKLHRKKLERGRIYIIAIVLAILKNFSYLDSCRGDWKA